MSNSSFGRQFEGRSRRAWLFDTRADGWSILVRLLVGLVVFLPEGIQKLAFPEVLGAGRFAHIGIPYPDLLGPFVGVVEMVCGTLTSISCDWLSHPRDSPPGIPLIISRIVAYHPGVTALILLGQDLLGGGIIQPSTSRDTPQYASPSPAKISIISIRHCAPKTASSTAI